MKLVFPGGEHPQVVLQPGVNSVGSAPDANIVIDRPGVQPRHCHLHVTPTGVMLDVPAEANVSVNGKVVNGLIALRDGDRVAFDRWEARLANMENVALGAGAVRSPAVPANDDLFATTVRPALPRFMLRGVSGKLFGRGFALAGPTTVGRAPECAVRLDETGISRLHARMLPSDEGVQIEDLGSTNGTFVNGRRVLHAEARAGDEIGFDTLRFRLIATVQDAEPAEAAAPDSMRSRLDPRLLWGLVVGMVLLAGAIVLAL
ncbi:MAG: FHA domain-containing protein [Lysobacter sp.]|nr:MAG: FHA domain-containing protein [Lysobacter sp.]